MKIEMPKMIISDPLIKKLWKEIELNPEKKKVNLMLGFKYFLNLWAKDKIFVNGVIPWKDFRNNVKKGLTIILKNTKSNQKIGVFSSGGTISSITNILSVPKDADPVILSEIPPTRNPISLP